MGKIGYYKGKVRWSSKYGDREKYWVINRDINEMELI